MARSVSKKNKTSPKKPLNKRQVSRKGKRTSSVSTKQSAKQVEYIELKVDESVVKLVGILVLGVLGVVALLVYGKKYNANQSGAGQVKIEQAGNRQQDNKPSVVTSYIGNSPVLGKKDAKVTIFEYGDYECPFCRRHEVQTFPKIKKEYIDTGKVKYVAKNFIAVDGHRPSAIPAAYAAMCVYKVAGNDAFWKFRESMVDAYENGKYGIPSDALKRLQNPNLVKKGLREIAKNIGVNLAKYDACLKDTKSLQKEFNEDQNYVMNKIAPNVTGGVGTPMFVVCKSPKDNKTECKGTVIMGAYPFDTFKKTIDALLK